MVVGVAPSLLQGESPARAQVPRLLEQALVRYGKRLQRTTDEFVFFARPKILAGNWTELTEMFSETGFASNAIRNVDLIISGNEDFLDGVEGASAELNIACKNLRKAAVAADKEAALKAWEAAVGSLNTVMSAVNKFLNEENASEDLPRFAVVPSNVEAYPRTLADVLRWCFSLDGLFGGRVGSACA